MPDEIDGAFDQQPPKVCMISLVKEIDTWLNGNFSSALDQIGELIICQAVEDAQRAELISAHQIVAR
jgi:hypothetical protein